MLVKARLRFRLLVGALRHVRVISSYTHDGLDNMTNASTLSLFLTILETKAPGKLHNIFRQRLT